MVLLDRVLVGGHGGDARVVLVGDEVVVVWHASCSLEYLHAGVLLLLLRVAVGVERWLAEGRRAVVFGSAGREAVAVVVVLLLQAVVVHVLAEVGKRGGSLELVAGMAHHGAVVRLPWHRGVALGCRRRAVASTVRDHVIKLRGVRPALVCSLPMLYHCCLPAETTTDGSWLVPRAAAWGAKARLTSSSNRGGHTCTAACQCVSGGVLPDLRTGLKSAKTSSKARDTDGSATYI